MLLTAKDSDEDILRGYSGKADYYLTKPFSEAQLRDGLCIVLNALQENRRRHKISERTTWTLENNSG
jgi:DNA-binding response OmpR family regulator